MQKYVNRQLFLMINRTFLIDAGIKSASGRMLMTDYSAFVAVTLVCRRILERTRTEQRAHLGYIGGRVAVLTTMMMTLFLE